MALSARRSIPFLAVLICALAVAAPGSVADPETGSDESKKEEKQQASGKKNAESPYAAAARKRPSAKPVVVYTNETLPELQKLPGVPAPEVEAAAAAKTPAKPKSALERLQEQQQQERDRERQRAEAALAVKKAEKRVSEFETRLRALRSPYLAPPQAPKNDDGTWEDANSMERVEQTQKQIEAARKALEQARQRLAELS